MFKFLDGWFRKGEMIGAQDIVPNPEVWESKRANCEADGLYMDELWEHRDDFIFFENPNTKFFVQHESEEVPEFVEVKCVSDLNITECGEFFYFVDGEPLKKSEQYIVHIIANHE